MTKKIKTIGKPKKVTTNFTTVWDADYWMSSNDMYCGFNMPDALVSKGEESEFAHGLPPYEKRKFYLADEYPAVPKNWIPSEGRKTSYFVPVKEDTGMWLDFNKNCHHKYEVAIVISVQGVNPITGMPCTSPRLEQYIDKCPKHDTTFGPHRYCKECGYKWPKQNYLCTTGTPKGNLWLDGFRTADGVVRQYILTMDKIKGVAANILKEDRVFAVGISFFLSVNPKPVVQHQPLMRGVNLGLNGTLYKMGGISKVSKTKTFSAKSISKGITTNDSWNDNTTYTNDVSKCCNITASSLSSSSAAGAEEDANMFYDATGGLDRLCEINDMAIDSAKYEVAKACENPKLSKSDIRSVSVKKVEVGAGANINQQVHADPEPLEFWRKEPESIICINYVLEEDAEKIISKGKISLEGHKESFLKKIPKGNPTEKIKKTEAKV